MKIRVMVEVEVDRVTGKFASKDDVVEAIAEEIEGAISGLSLDGLGADGDSEYEVTDVSVGVA